jgi:hypothetical protein
MALSTWLDLPVEGTSNIEGPDDGDNQWLRDLIRLQFDEEDDEDDLLLDEEFF